MKITGAKVHLDLESYGKGYALLHPSGQGWELSLFLLRPEALVGVPPSWFVDQAPVPCYGFEGPHPEFWPTDEEILDAVQALLPTPPAPAGARSPS